jgi:ABC-2 type transport system permease protein
MIAVHRIESVVLRHMFLFRRSLDRLADSIYWPVMDLILWGLTIKWISTGQGVFGNVLLVMLTAIVFWQIVWRANYEISVNLLEEFWTQNLVNLFATPLKVGEWVSGVMIVGAAKTVLTVIVGLMASWLLYSLNIFSVGYLIIPFMVSLIVFGWSLGFFASALIVYYGPRIQTLAWAMGFMLAPFSAVYYPLEVLPGWAQKVGSYLPTTYVFEGMRLILAEQTMPLENLALAALLNIFYLALTLCFFFFMFEKKRAKGLAKQG